ncbi:MAG: CDP-alcohol phosphatidyltransferase family protein [Patescibacteria group bacterium]
MREPTKTVFAVVRRRATDVFYKKLPIPKVHPDIISFLSLITTVLFLIVLKYSKPWALFLIFLTLFLDGLDGFIARKFNLKSKHGYWVDLFTDRLSEGIMFFPFLNPWFYLFLVNTIIAFLGIPAKKHLVLPLRFIFAFYFLIWEVIR